MEVKDVRKELEIVREKLRLFDLEKEPMPKNIEDSLPILQKIDLHEAALGEAGPVRSSVTKSSW